MPHDGNLHHGPANGRMRPIPMDTTETLSRYHAWRLERAKEEVYRKHLSLEWLHEILAPLGRDKRPE